MRGPSDTALIIATRAAPRVDGNLMPPPPGIEGDPAKAIEQLIRRGWAREATSEVPTEEPWRETSRARWVARLTVKGCRALNLEPDQWPAHLRPKPKRRRKET